MTRRAKRCLITGSMELGALWLAAAALCLLDQTAQAPERDWC
jgi:hypothetical protein